jgi:hypothetical protein
MTQAANLAGLGSNVTTAGNLSSASTLTFQTNSTTALTINSSQKVLVNTTTARANFFNSTNSPIVQVEGTSADTSMYSAIRNSNDTSTPWVVLAKSRGTTVGSNTIVQSADGVGSISFQGNDGTEFVEAARITGLIDGTPGANDMPGALTFGTTADGAASPSERMRIDSAGNVGIGVTPSAWGSNFKVIESAGNSSAVYAAANVNGLRLTSNLYNDNTNFIYKTTGEAAVYAINTSIHQWSTAPSGTAGTTATLTERMRLSSAGGFSVGTTSDPGAGAIYATGNITAFFSDIRLKNNEGRIDNALDKVSKLSGIYYTTNETAKEYGYTDEARQVGVIAQEVKEVLPEIVKAAPFDLDENGKSKSGQDYMTVQYDKLVPLLIEAIKELSEKVAKLEGK